MKKYELTIYSIQHAASAGQMVSCLQSWLDDGWRLVTVIMSDNVYNCVLQRKIKKGK